MDVFMCSVYLTVNLQIINEKKKQQQIIAQIIVKVFGIPYSKKISCYVNPIWKYPYIYILCKLPTTTFMQVLSVPQRIFI